MPLTSPRISDEDLAHIKDSYKDPSPLSKKTNNFVRNLVLDLTDARNRIAEFEKRYTDPIEVTTHSDGDNRRFVAKDAGWYSRAELVAKMLGWEQVHTWAGSYRTYSHKDWGHAYLLTKHSAVSVANQHWPDLNNPAVVLAIETILDTNHLLPRHRKIMIDYHLATPLTSDDPRGLRISYSSETGRCFAEYETDAERYRVISAALVVWEWHLSQSQNEFKTKVVR